MTAAKSENRPKYVTGQHIFLLKFVILEKLNCNEEKFVHIPSEKMVQKKLRNSNICLKISNLEGIAYLLKTGCQWQLLPEYYGAWQTVYCYFRTVGERGFFSKLKRKLLENKRIRRGKRKSPSLAVIDSQSVR